MKGFVIVAKGFEELFNQLDEKEKELAMTFPNGTDTSSI